MRPLRRRQSATTTSPLPNSATLAGSGLLTVAIDGEPVPLAEADELVEPPEVTEPAKSGIPDSSLPPNKLPKNPLPPPPPRHPVAVKAAAAANPSNQSCGVCFMSILTSESFDPTARHDNKDGPRKNTRI